MALCLEKSIRLKNALTFFVARRGDKLGADSFGSSNGIEEAAFVRIGHVELLAPTVEPNGDDVPVDTPNG